MVIARGGVHEPFLSPIWRTSWCFWLATSSSRKRLVDCFWLPTTNCWCCLVQAIPSHTPYKALLYFVGCGCILWAAVVAACKRNANNHIQLVIFGFYWRWLVGWCLPSLPSFERPKYMHVAPYKSRGVDVRWRKSGRPIWKEPEAGVEGIKYTLSQPKVKHGVPK